MANKDKGTVRHGRRHLKEDRQRTTAAHYEVAVSSRALLWALLIVALTLLACHAAVQIYHYRVQELPWLLRQAFDVDQENNLPTWYSGLLLLIASVFLWICARKKRTEGDRWFAQWYVLAVGFLLMSVDEVAGIHETINSFIVITWAIPGGIMALVIGLAFLPFMLHLPKPTARLFALAGAVYLAGAVGFEIVGNSLVSQRLRDTLEYNLWTLAEESLERLGVILFLHTLLRYMRGPGASTVHVPLDLT